MKYIKLFEEFLNESSVTPTEIDINQFPNPVTGILSKIFVKKGELDGNPHDDKIKTKQVSIASSKLNPSQKAIYLGKALGMAINGVEGGDLGAIFSKDNYILDGHHRWAATMFNNHRAKVKGFLVDLSIGDLIPVLRSLGDVFGNRRRGKPSGGDINIFKASVDDAINAIETGKNMNPKFYDMEKSIEWLDNIGGRIGLQKALARIQSTLPPTNALPRDEMPVIDADKNEDKKAADLLSKGKIDVKEPYA